MSKRSTSSKAHLRTLAARRRALGALVERERPGVVARLGKQMAHVDAEEVFQEACLRALQRLSQQQNPAQLRAWFGTVLRTVVSRGAKPEQGPSTDGWSEGRAPDAAPETCSCGLDALATLPERQRAILHGSVFDGRAPSLLAVDESTTPNNMRVMLHRARAQLRARWERKCGPCISGELGTGCACQPLRDSVSR